MVGKDPDPFFYLRDKAGRILYKSDVKTTTKDAVWESMEVTSRLLLNGAYLEIMDKDLHSSSDSIGKTILLDFESFAFGETNIVINCASSDLMSKRGDCGTVAITPVAPSRQWSTFQLRYSTDNIPVFGGYLQAAARNGAPVPERNE